MSSVDVRKNTFTCGSAMIRHACRHDGKQDVDYRNKYIDRALSYRNYTIDAPRYRETSRQVFEKLKKRVEEIDLVQPPKRRVKDRVTIITYTVVAPKHLTADQEQAFFKIAHEEIAKFSGGRENISTGFVHHDEVHDYIDTGGKRTTSRAHMHVAGIPYTPEKGVNGKAFTAKTRLRAINKAVDDRCRSELGIRFMTGQKGLSGRTVEELQAASETRALEEARQQIEKDIEIAKETLKSTREAVSDAKTELSAMQAQKSAVEAEIGQIDRIMAEARERSAQIKPEKSLFKSEQVVKIPLKEYEALTERALLNEKLGTLELRDKTIEFKAQAEQEARETMSRIQDYKKNIERRTFNEIKELAEYKQIKEEHPEMFDKSGKYIRTMQHTVNREEDIEIGYGGWGR